MKKSKILQQKAITLIALIITIIILLILAGVTISSLTNGGILDKATASRDQFEAAQIKEEIALAWNSIQIDAIMNNWDNATKASALQTELAKNDSTATVTLNSDNELDITYKGYETTINPDNGSIAELAKAGSGNGGNGNGNSNTDVYRGLATESDVNKDLFYYKITSNPTASTEDDTKVASINDVQVATNSPGTVSIIGMRLKPIFVNAFGEDSDNWPDIKVWNNNTFTINSAYVNVLQPYVGNKLVIPNKVKLNAQGLPDENGQEYIINKIEGLLCQGYGMDSQYGIHYDDYEYVYYSQADLEDVFLSSDLNINIVIPEGVTWVNISGCGIQDGLNCAVGCGSVKSISFPNSLTYIDYGCCRDCTELTELVIPKGVQEIEWCAFRNCNKLTRITGPLGVASMECYPKSLETFICNNDVIEHFNDEDFNDYSHDYENYHVIRNINLIVPWEKVRMIGKEGQIGHAAFQYLNITEFSVPSCITRIGPYSFYYNGGDNEVAGHVKKLSLNSDNLTIDNNALNGLESLYLNSASLVQQFYNGSLPNNNDLEGTEIYIKEEFLDSDAIHLRYSTYEQGDEKGGFHFDEIENGYAKYVYDESFNWTEYLNSGSNDDS